jgi:hypothetical protein
MGKVSGGSSACPRVRAPPTILRRFRGRNMPRLFKRSAAVISLAMAP